MISSLTKVPVKVICLCIASLLLIFGTAVAAAPEAAFSGTPTSGTVPLAVAFTDTSAGDPTGWAWFFGDESYGETWTEQTTNAGWSARSGHSSVALADGSIVVMGGYDGTTCRNDTWRSTDNGVTWTLVNASAGWTARLRHTSVALADGSILLMGGSDGSDLRNDVWRSDDGGATWTEVNASAGWSMREAHTAVVLPDGSVILMGGWCYGSMNDVWRSQDSGATWIRVNASAGWSKRVSPASVAMPDGSIILMGGYDSANFRNMNDTWRSTDCGATWTRVNESSGWSERDVHTAVAMPDGSIVLMGGSDNTELRNDVWRSCDYGATWTEVNPSAGWSGRASHTSVAMPDGSILLMGGTGEDGTNRNDVWRLQPAGSSEQDPQHEYTASGTYSVTLQAFNADGCDSTQTTGYVTVLAVPPTAAFSGTPTSGLAPLTVAFTDMSASEPSSWLWNFGDGETSTEQHPAHTYAVAGTYTVNLTVSNTAGTDMLSETGYVEVLVAPPVAAFSGTPVSGRVPLTVAFTDISTGSPTVWNWSFGDGETSTEQHPAHTYAAAGTYTVNLTVSNTAGTDALSRAGFITVSAPAVVPTAAFSGTPVSGTAPLTVTFTDRSTDDPTGWAWFFGDERYSEPWTKQNASSGWSAREGHTAVAMPDGSILLMGGIDSSWVYRNDVWRSTDYGTTWTEVNPSAGWSGRSLHTVVTMPNGTIVLMGGYNGTTQWNDTWRSTDYGATWTQVNASSGWTPRILSASVAMPDGSIVLLGGYNSPTPYNDVWRSTDSGATWSLVNASAGWVGRYDHTAVATPDGSIILMGGYNGKYWNDTWRSDDNGATWTRVNTSSGWTARAHHTSVVMPDGSIVLMGGLDGTALRNDTWRSVDYGATWTQVNASAGWAARVQYASVAMPDGSIVIMGGSGGNIINLMNDTWRLQPAGSSEQNPSYTYTAPGTYSVTLQAFNADGYTCTRETGYVTVTPPVVPVAAFSGTLTSGAAPLTVTFTDESIGSPTGWAWFFGDESYDQPWMLVNASSGWAARAGHSSVALPDGSIVLMGGSDKTTTYRNDTWRSTDGGATWTLVNASSGWTGRAQSASVATPDGSILLMGGFDDTYDFFRNDVWRSNDYGATWTCVNASAEWPERFFATGVVMPDGSILLMGGFGWSGTGPLNDTWRSDDRGATWTLVNASSGWAGRYGHAAVTMPDGSVVLTGGYDGTASRNDTWRSDDCGATWALVNASSGWTARQAHSSVAMPDGSIILAGGWDGNGRSDMWRSTDGGATWTLVNPDAGWTARHMHTGLAMPDGSILLMGGSSSGSLLNDTWRLQPAGSSEQNPSHTYTLPGNYTVTLVVDGGLSTATEPDYIRIIPVLFGDATEDGEINQADTLVVLQEIVGLREKPDAGTDRFRKTDVTRNSAIDAGDALFIAQYNVGLRDPWFALL